MPGNRQQGSNNELRQKKWDDMRRAMGRAKNQVEDVFIKLIAQYPPIHDTRKFTSLIKDTNRLLTKIDDQLTYFDEWQASFVQPTEELLHYPRQFDRIHKLIGLWNEILLNLNDLLTQSWLNNYTKEFPGRKRAITNVETGETTHGISNHDIKNAATRALERAEEYIKQMTDVMAELREEQYAHKLDSLRQSLPSQSETKPDTWVSDALLDSSLLPLIHEGIRQIPSDSWSLQLRNGFIEALSPDSAGRSFAGTNQQCVIALTGLKLLSDTLVNVTKKLADRPKGSSTKSQHYNSACTTDLEIRLTSIADATESLLADSPVLEEVRLLRQSYLNKIKQLNLEELFEQLDKEVGTGKRKRFSLKDWITKSLFTGAKGWSAFYKEYQRRYPVLSKHKAIARRIEQATGIMANYLQEAQKIAAQQGKPFKIKEVAREETRLISLNDRSTFIALFDHADNVFADCQIPIGASTVPSSNRGLAHDGYANFMKTCLYRYQGGRAELLFQGYRHSAAPPIDLKDKQEKVKKTLANIKTGLVQQFADTLQHRIDSGDRTLKDLEKNHGDKDSALSMSVASLSLLTPEHHFLEPFHDKGSNNAQLTMIANAFAELDGKPLQVRLKDGRTLYVRPDICLMNAPTNELGAIHYYSSEDFDGLNQRGFAKLISRIQKHLAGEKFEIGNDKIKKIKREIENLLEARPAQRQACIDEIKKATDAFWEEVDDETDPFAKEQCDFLQLAVEIIEIHSRGLRENVLNMLEFQACFMMINYMMGSIVEMYCKSGKDRTGAIDEMIKAKYLTPYEKGANGRFFSYTPLTDRAGDGANSPVFKFIDGPLATMQRCGASPFSAGENTYGARNLQRNKFLPGFASKGETPIDLALAKLNKKPFSLANATIRKKAVMALGGVLLLTPALLYWAGQFINHHLIQRPIRFYRAKYANISLRALAAETLDNPQALTDEPSAKVRAKTKEDILKKEGDRSFSLLKTVSSTIAAIVAREKSPARALRQPRTSEAQAALRETMDGALRKVDARVGQLNTSASPSNDAFGKVQLVLTPLSDERVEARTFLDTTGNGKNISTGHDTVWRESLTETCKDINHYFASLVSGRHAAGARVTSSNGHVFIGELFAKNTSKGEAKKLKPAGDNNSNAYDKAQASLIDLVALSLPNRGITQNTQGVYGIRRSDGQFIPPTLQLTIGRQFNDTITLRHVLAIMLKVRELLERHNKSVGYLMPVELTVIDQRNNGRSESISFSEKNGYRKIQKLAPNGLGRLAAKADARENQIKKAFSKFNLNLELASKKVVKPSPPTPGALSS